MIKNTDKNSKITSIIKLISTLIFIYVIYKMDNNIISISALGVGAIFLYLKRYDVVPYLGLQKPRVSTKEKTEIPNDEVWFDDYYTIKYIDEKTIAIGEPRYWQRNYNYLILGDEKAILFDSGPGVRDISKVVRSLTDLPVISMISHYHFDHVGSIEKFDEMYIGYNQLKRQTIVNGNTITPSKKSFMGNIEGIKAKAFNFDKIVKNKEIIDLGNRKVQVLDAQGHDCESIVLYDEESNQLFAGDYLLKGPIIAHKMAMPTANLDDYKYSIKNILDNISKETLIYLSHPMDLSDQTMSYKDIDDLNTFFSEVNKNNIIPKKKQINEDIYVIY